MNWRGYIAIFWVLPIGTVLAIVGLYCLLRALA